MSAMTANPDEEAFLVTNPLMKNTDNHLEYYVFFIGGHLERLAHLCPGPPAGVFFILLFSEQEAPARGDVEEQEEGQQAAQAESHKQHRRAQGEAIHGDRKEKQAAQPEPGEDTNYH